MTCCLTIRAACRFISPKIFHPLLMYLYIRAHYLFPTFILLLLLSACRSNTGSDGLSLKPGKTITFPSPFPVDHRFSKIFYDKNGEAILCTFNTKTFKRTDLYTLDGKLIKSVPLKDVFTIERSVYGVCPISADSFWVLSNYSNYLYLLGDKGNILKQIKINAAYSDSMRIEVRGSTPFGFCVDNNTFLFNNIYYYKDESKPYTLSSYFKANKANPYFTRMESPLDSVPVLTYGLPGFYNRILKNEDALSAEGSFYMPFPGGILLTSAYTDSLFLINDKDLTIERGVKMTSKYSRIGCDPLMATGFNNDEFNVLFNHAGGVSGMTYDPYRNLIYIVLHEEAPKSATEPSRKKSMLVYDTQLRLKDEIRLDYDTYDLNEMYVLKEGLLIRKDKNDDSHTQFQWFYVDKK